MRNRDADGFTFKSGVMSDSNQNESEAEEEADEKRKGETEPTERKGGRRISKPENHGLEACLQNMKKNQMKHNSRR
jgi:hypothetical protein